MSKNLYIKPILLLWFLLAAIIISGSSSYAQLTGVKTIPGDYASIASAIADLNTNGVGSGGVTFNVTAGYTEIITDSLVVTATGVSGSPIIFQKSGPGANPLITRTDAGSKTTTTLGGQGDAVITIQGSDYLTFDGIDIAADQATIEYGYYLRKAGPTDGCKNVTIKNALIDLTKGSSGYVAGIYSSNNDATSLVSSATGITVTSTGGRNENVTITGCTIQDVFTGIYLRSFNHTVSPNDFQDQNFVIGSNGAGNIIQNFAGNSAATSYGVYLINHTNPNVSYNTINNIANGGANATSTLYGIFMSQSGTNPGGNVVVNNNTITLGQVSTSAAHGINIAPGCSSVDISNNTFSYGSFASTSTSYLISCSNNSPNITVSGNQISGTINKTGAGEFDCYYNNGSPTSGTATITNNNFSNISLTGSSLFYGIRQTTGTSQLCIITNNIISNITTGTSSGYGIYQGYGSAGSTVNGNIVFNLTGAGSLYGIYFGSSAPVSLTVFNNNVYNLTSSAALVVGFYNSSGTSNSIYKNQVYNLTSNNASATVYGVQVAGGTAAYLYNNLISDLKAPAASATDAIRGINITSTTSTSTVGLYYNTIYLNAASSGTNFGTTGIYHTNSTTATTASLDMRNNIVVNNSTPAGTGFTVAFRRSAANTALNNYSATSNNNSLYAGVPSASNLIFYDGTNSDQTMSAFKTRVTPREVSSFAENVPFINSTTAPFNLHMNTAIATQTESGGAPVSTPVAITEDFDGNTRNGVTPDVGADEFGGTPLDLIPPAISYSPLLNTSSTTNRTIVVSVTDPSGVPSSAPGWPYLYWKINSGAYTGVAPDLVNGSQYTYNFGAGAAAGDTVSYYVVAQDNAGTPNVGAYPSAGAGGFTTNPPAASTPPTTPSSYLITAAPLAGDYTVGSTLFNQVTGLNITYEKTVKKVIKNVWVANKVSESKKDSKSDIIYGDPNSGSFQMKEIEEITWIPMSNGKPYTGNLYIKKTEHPEYNYPAGVNGIYASITSAVTDLNLRGVSAPVNFLLTDALYSSGETFPVVVNITNEALPSASNTVTFKPNTGVTASMVGSSATGILISYGVNYIIINGSNAGGNDRNLTFINNSTASNSYVLGIFAGAKNNSIKNCIVKAGINSSTSWAIILNASVGGYNNTVIQNNELLKATTGLQFAGVSGGVTNGGSITGNIFGSDVDSLSLGNLGMLTSYIDGVNITSNSFKNIKVGTTPRGLVLSTGTVNTTVDKNLIKGIIYTGTGGYGGRGIYVNTGSAASNIQISNNFIYNIGGDGYSGFSGSSPVGMYFDGITGGLNIYHNSVYMSGNLSYNTGTLTTAILFYTSTITNIDLRNNIFVNDMNNPNNAGGKNYAIYSTAPAGSFSNINYNDYFVSGTQGVFGYLGADIANLAAWKTATAQDLNSLSADPKFKSGTDLHIDPIYDIVSNNGTYLASVPQDFDGETRNNPPDIGADEYIYTPPVEFVDWCNLQWPATATITEGENVTVYAQVWEPGVTDLPGQGPNINAWIGISTTNTDPATWTTWIPAVYNVDVGNNDEYMAQIGQSLTPGTYYYASKFQIVGGATRYGGFNGGYWDGVNNISGVLTVNTFSITSFPYSQSFDVTTFPPAGWQNVQITNVGLFERVTAGTHPVIATHSGAAMTRYNSYSFTTGTSAALITPKIQFTGNAYMVKFWMYRDGGYLTNLDRLSVFMNSTPSITGADSLGNVFRSKNLEPVVAADGWYEYSFIITGVTGTEKYILLKGYSGYGNDLYVDDFSIETVPDLDYAVTSFIQVNGIPNPFRLNIPENETVKGEEVMGFDPAGLPSAQSDNFNTSAYFDVTRKENNLVIPGTGLLYPANVPITLKTIVANFGATNPAYQLDWSVDGIAGTPVSRPGISLGSRDTVTVETTPLQRGTLTSLVNAVVPNDTFPNNSAALYRTYVYPDSSIRIRYDNGANIPSTFIGFGDSLVTTYAAVRFKAASNMQLANIDAYYRNTNSIDSVEVQIHAAGLDSTAPGALLYTKKVSGLNYSAPNGSYFSIPLGTDAPAFLANSDYWVVIKFMGIAYPMGAQSSSITTGHSYVSSDNTTYYPLVITSVEYAWLMRVVGVPYTPPPPPPTFTVWERTAANATLPAWFGTDTERGIAWGRVRDNSKAQVGRVFVVSRNGGVSVKVINDSTGADLGTMDVTGISGGTYALNDIEVSEDGKIFGTNMTTNVSTSAFKVYMWDSVTSAPVNVINFTGTRDDRVGDKFTLIGDYSTNNARLYAASSNSDTVYKWTMSGGVFNTTPELIALSDNSEGGSATVGASWEGFLYYNATGITPRKYDSNGALLGVIPASVVATGSNSIKYIGTVDTMEYFVTFSYGTGNNNARIVGAPQNNAAGAILFGVTPTMGTNANTNGAGDVAIRQNPDGTVNVYVLTTNNGIGAYRTNYVVPVELTSFAANVDSRDVLLNWSTSTESNTSVFEVERSIAGEDNWTSVGSVKAAGSSTEKRNYSYADKNLNSGKYAYRLRIVDLDGTYKYSAGVEAEIGIPVQFGLSQNYPNPFNPSTKINYQLPVDANVTIELFDITGQKIATLVNQDMQAGYHSLEVSGLRYASGMYIYRMTAVSAETGKNFVDVKKMMMLK